MSADTPAGSLSSPRPLDSPYGGLEIGIIISFCLYGAICIQAFNYYQADFKNDKLYIRILVVWCCVLETIHTVLLSITLYEFSITHFADYGFLLTAHWHTTASVVVTSLISAPVQIFFAIRIYKLSKSWYIPVISSLASIARLGVCTAGAVFIDFRNVRMYQKEYLIQIVVALALAGPVDVLNTCALCHLLLRSRSQAGRSRLIIDKLVAWTIETGLITSICSVASLILLLSMRTEATWLSPLMFTGKLYSNSFLATLNGRVSLRSIDHGGTATHTINTLITFAPSPSGRSSLPPSPVGPAEEEIHSDSLESHSFVPGIRKSVNASRSMVASNNPYECDDLGEFFASCIEVARREACGSPDIQGGISLDSLPPLPYPGVYTDFYGFPSNPRSIFSTCSAWYVNPSPHESWRVFREARPVCEHQMQDVWVHTVGKRVYEFLDSFNVQWTSIDPVRFADSQGKGPVSPLYLWIGIIPESFPFEAAKAAAEGCKDIVDEAGFPDVEIAFRESIITRSAGHKLLHIAPQCHNQDPIRDLRSPFTPNLGIHIAPLKTPHNEGTGALYIRESKESERVFLLTAGHVAIPPRVRNDPRQTRRLDEIVVLGSMAYNNSVNRLMSVIGREVRNFQISNTNLEKLGVAIEGETFNKTRAREKYEARAQTARRTIEEANRLHDEVSKHWTTPMQRVLGHVVHSPPISVAAGPKPFTQDWALINLYLDKIDWSTFLGNKIYIPGSDIWEVNSMVKFMEDFVRKLVLKPDSDGQSNFCNSVEDGFLQIQGFLSEEEIHKPKQLDKNSETSLHVLKNGMATGRTVGRASSMESFVREYSEDGTRKTSIEIAVYPYSFNDGAFSAPGDSGSIVVDRHGRIVGLLTGGAGNAEDIDVTYLTPYWWIDEQIKKEFPDSFLYETVNYSKK